MTFATCGMAWSWDLIWFLSAGDGSFLWQLGLALNLLQR